MLEKWRWTPEIDWGQLDWGNVPGWITAVTAVVVGIFAIGNVLIARKSYQDGKWVDQVATARLVWSVATTSRIIEKGDPIPELGVDRTHYWLPSHATKSADGFVRVNQRSVYVVVEVTNSSKEPIGDVQTRIYDALGRPTWTT